MTSIWDEVGQKNVTLGYDAYGRANYSQEGSNANTFSFSYPTDQTQAPHWQIDKVVNYNVPVMCRIHHWVFPQQTTFTDPSGQQITMGASSVAGQPRLVSQSQPSGSGSLASTSTESYDVAGNITNYADFNGNQTCYGYDLSRNLTLVKLEGLSTVAACPANIVSYVPSTSDPTHPQRKTTTAWHPNWVLKAQEAQAAKLTTWVYNGQPDPIAGGTASCAPSSATLPDGKPIAVLCAQYEQATTDTTGALGLSATVTGATRQWSYTYNQYGQVLTATTPKLSSTDTLSHTTTYTYYPSTSLSAGVGHTVGDLATVTNPLGQVTTYTSYDAAGRLLSSTDANGTVTTSTYTPRGWLQTQTVTPAAGAALTTSYTYFPTGLLQTVTLPDASVLTYGYDGAHRLTDVTDGAGNKVHYVLDNSGNRTSDQVSDASGTLISTIARVFDNLNRVQSVTGALH
jgi:YD repeat-containing protein